MTKPGDDLEAVRIVVEALQGFDARDQERILRWAHEKLSVAALPAPQPATSTKPTPPTAFDLPATPPAGPPISHPNRLEAAAVEAREVQRPVVEQHEAAQLPLEQPEAEQPAVALPVEDLSGVEQQEAVNTSAPRPEHKNRALVIGIIFLAAAVVFLIVMITWHGK